MTNDQLDSNGLMTNFAGKRVLITGGLGFIGSNLAQALVPMGAKVTLLDAVIPEFGGNRFNIKGIEGDLRLVEGDIRDAELIGRQIKGADYIFHLAGQVSYLDAKDRPFDDLDFNGKGNLTVLEAVRDKSPGAKIVFSSSRLVYGRIRSLPVTEEHPTEPLSLYGIHKLLGEKYYSYYARTFNINGVSVRIPNPYGPRQQMKHSRYAIVGWFMRQAMDGQTIQIFGDGSQQRDYIYIDDIIDAMLQVAVKGSPGEVYNVGTNERIKFSEMVEMILEEIGSGKKEFVSWPENYEKNETGDYMADTTKLSELTGWKARVPLREGIHRMAEYYRENRAHYW